MIANLLIGGAIFGYAAWALYRHINRSRKGKCAACARESSCESTCASTGELGNK